MRRRVIKKIFFIALFLIVLFIFSPLTIAQENNLINPGDIVITEIMIDPQAVSDSNGEWLEIFNPTGNDIDLVGCTFSDNGTNNFTVATSTIILANNYLVLGRNEDLEINGGVIIDYLYSGFTLANSEDEIIITCADLEIDKVEYSSSLDFPITAGASLTLDDIASDNNVVSNWCVATSVYGLGDLGTPGGPNDDCSITIDDGGDTPPDNVSPIAKASGDTVGAVNQLLNFDGSGSYDPDGDNLTFTWDMGDGAIKTGQTISYAYGQTGVWQVTLTVNDGRDSRSDYLTVKITAPQITDFKNKVIITELLPNPKGSDNEEWVELKNISDQTVDLAGLKLRDAAGKTYSLNSSDYPNLDILPQNFFLIKKDKSKISLNNTPPESLTLLTPDEKEIDSVTYETSAQEDYAYALINNEWTWTDTPTPNKNNLPIAKVIEILTTDKPATTSDEVIAEEMSLDSTCQATSSDQIILSELWPSPQGDDRELEFIEIKNKSDQDINLCNWLLADKNNDYSLPLDSIIPAKGYLLISRQDSKLSLNNTGDIIKLYDYKNKLIDQTDYPRAKTDLSWSRNNQGEWSWTNEVTPEEENTFAEATSDQTASSKNKTTKNANYIYTAIGDITDFTAKQKLIVEGWVTAPPGILGAQIMYISGSGGLQIYQYKKDWPQLDVGDKVRIQGTLSYPYERPRLKISSRDNITKLESDKINDTSIPSYKIDELADELIGSLININGEVIEKTKNKLFLDDGSAEIEVYIKSSTGIVLPDIGEGDILEVTGILNKVKNRLQLLPRFNDDIKTVKVAGWETDKLAVTKNDSKQGFIQITNFLYITFVGLIIALSGLIYKLKKPHGR